MAEKPLITPLEAEEIKTAISVFVGERTLEELSKNCDLYQCSYPKFKCHIVIEGTLDKSLGPVALPEELIPFRCEFTIPYTPPNMIRKQTGQSIPVLAEKADGTEEVKSVFYRKEKSRYIDD